jgi:hypothetical protein
VPVLRVVVGAARRLRAAVAVAAAGFLVLGTAAPAAAHSGVLPDSDYYRSRVVSVTPAVPGLTLQIDPAGESLTLTNDTGKPVEVPGYVGEPYLRFTGSGVEQNTNSISAFLNGTLVIQGLPQQTGGTDKPPEWKVVSTTNTYTWHDHRTHWMAQQRPPVVAADPTHAHLVFPWQVPVSVDGTAVVVAGDLSWTGEPAISSSTLTVLALTVTGVVAAGLVWLRHRNRGRRPAVPDAETPDPRLTS